MQLSHRLRADLIGLFAVFGASISSLASADSGTVIISKKAEDDRRNEDRTGRANAAQLIPDFDAEALILV
jgi:hypothetical protein